MTYIISILAICGISTAAIMAKAISYVEKAEEAIRRQQEARSRSLSGANEISRKQHCSKSA